MITLDMPIDVRAYVLEFQARIKGTKRVGQYNQQQAIIDIIRDHRDSHDDSPKNKEEEHSKTEET